MGKQRVQYFGGAPVQLYRLLDRPVLGLFQSMETADYAVIHVRNCIHNPQKFDA